MAGPAFGPGVVQGAAAGFQGQNLLIEQMLRQLALQSGQGQLQDQAAARAGQGGAYDAISKLFGGAPPQGPMAPPPGQASQPAGGMPPGGVDPRIGQGETGPVNPALAAAAGRVGPGLQQFQGMQGGGPPPGPNGPVGPPSPARALLQGGQPQPPAPQQQMAPQSMDLQSLVKAVDTSMPNAPPQAKMAALEKVSGLMTSQAQVQFAQMKAQFDMQMQVAKLTEQANQHLQMSLDRNASREDRAAAARHHDETLGAIAQLTAATRTRGQDMTDDRGRRGQDMRYGQGLSPEDTQTLAEAWQAGDHTATAGLTPGDRRAVLGRAAQLARGEGAGAPGPDGAPAKPAGTGRDLAAAKVGLQGEGQAARSGAAQATRIAIGAQELKEFGPLLLDASEKIDRSKFPSLNSLMIAAQRGTGGEDVVRFTSMIQATKNAYAQIMTRGGQTTVESMKRADDVLNKAWSTGQIRAAVDQLDKEADAALRAAEKVVSRTKERVSSGGKATPQAPAAAPGLPPGWTVKEVGGEGGGGSNPESEGGDGPGEGPVERLKSGGKVQIKGRNAPSVVDAVWGKSPPGEDDSPLGRILKAKRGAGALSAAQ